MSDEKDPRFLEDVLIKMMYTNEEVRDKVIPFLDVELFDRKENVDIVKHALSFMQRFSKFPNAKESKIDLDSVEVYDHLKKIMNINTDEYAGEFLMGELEDFFKRKMIANVCTNTILALNDDELKSDYVDKLRASFAFSFDTSVGMDVFGDDERMYDFFHSKRVFVPSTIRNFDRVIDGGFHTKSLSLFLAPTNVGKSLIMTSLAVSQVFDNKNVLYISCEMSEEKLGERAYANAMNVPVRDLKNIDKDTFFKKNAGFKKKFTHKFKLKEYPTGTLNTNMIRNLLKEFELKQKFKPDIIYLDYLALMRPSFISKNSNSYESLKYITEELRGLAVEMEIPIVSAIQTGRGGIESSDLDLTDIAESIGTAFTADIVVAVTQSEEMAAAGKYAWKILKNRYGPKNIRLTALVDFDYMRLSYDRESDADFIVGDELSPTSKKDKEVDDAVDLVSAVKDKSEKTMSKNFMEFE